MTRPLAHRVVVVLWAALMLVLPAAEAVVDARISASGEAIVHVEDEQRRDCPRVHAHDCAICQHLSLASLPAGTGRPRSVDAGGLAPPTVALGTASTGWQASTRPRAPPRPA